MKIEKLDKLKFTSIKYDGDIIHFKYDNEHYTIENGGTEMTLVVKLSKGRMKCHLEYISGRYGMISRLIIYKNNKRTLSNIDKWNFVKKLIQYELIEPTEEQKIEIIKEEIKDLELQKQEIQQQINYLESQV
jgi:hypothetical protein